MNFLQSAVIASTAAFLLGAGTQTGAANPAENSPYLEQIQANRVFWGDTHVHTSYSTDAGIIGNSLGPDAALRYAKGEMVTSSIGMKTRLVRPLDWMVIADHAENLGLAPMIAESNPRLLANPWCKIVHDLVKAGENYAAYAKWGEEGIATGRDPLPDPELQSSMWARIIKMVDEHNAPGVFTAFHGFEWTSTYDFKNLHRNVIFRDDKDKVSQVVPLSAFDTLDVEELWDYLEDYQKKSGGKVLAIPTARVH